MEISISNIAWNPGEEAEIASLLPTLGVKAVEIAPARITPTPQSYREFWKGNGVEISSMQALLFQKDELVLFESDDKRQQMLEYLFLIVEAAEQIGASKLVFGAPKNRCRGTKSMEEVLPVAISFFKTLGEKAIKHGVIICLEANPLDYGTDFIVTTQEAADLVRQVNSRGFRLHLDTGAIMINSENFQSLIQANSDIIKHVHLSAPFLAPIYKQKFPLQEFVRSLKSINYRGLLSIEMKSLPANTNREHVCRSIEYVSEVM